MRFTIQLRHVMLLLVSRLSKSAHLPGIKRVYVVAHVSSELSAADSNEKAEKDI